MTSPRPDHAPWRVCVTRDEDADGVLSRGLRDQGFAPVACPVLVEAAPADGAPLADAARHLERYAWIVCASARAVRAVSRASGRAFPAGLHAAAVGRATARALVLAGAVDPLTAEGDGAEPLWTALAHADRWHARRVLVPTTAGGRRLLIERLRDAGAVVDEVEAYRMAPREPHVIAAEWTAAAPDAVVLASPRAAAALVEAIGAQALGSLHAVLAIGATTAAALQRLGVPCVVASAADFGAAAATLAACRAAQAS